MLSFTTRCRWLGPGKGKGPTCALSAAGMWTGEDGNRLLCILGNKESSSGYLGAVPLTSLRHEPAVGSSVCGGHRVRR